MENNIKLRPHHLLCTDTYRGKGYNKEFSENMDTIVSKLKSEEIHEIEIMYSTDDLCDKCKFKIDENKCFSNEKVIKLDEKVTEYFKIKEGKYIYKDILRYIKENMTEVIFEDICSNCSWYKESKCKELFMSENY